MFEFNSPRHISWVNLFLFLDFSQEINDDICILSGFKHTSEEIPAILIRKQFPIHIYFTRSKHDRRNSTL